MSNPNVIDLLRSVMDEPDESSALKKLRIVLHQLPLDTQEEIVGAAFEDPGDQFAIIRRLIHELPEASQDRIHRSQQQQERDDSDTPNEDLGNEIIKARNYLSLAESMLRDQMPQNPQPNHISILDKMERMQTDQYTMKTAKELEEKWEAPASNDPREYVRRARDTLGRLSALDADTKITMDFLGKQISGSLGSAVSSAVAWLHAKEAEIAFIDRNRELAIKLMEKAINSKSDDHWKKRLEFFRYADFPDSSSPPPEEKKKKGRWF